MKMILILFVILSAIPQPLEGQTTAQQIIDDLQPALDTQTVAILHIDLKRVELETITKQLSEPLAEAISDKRLAATQVRLLGQLLSGQDQKLEELKNLGVEELNLLFKLGPIHEKNRLLVFKFHSPTQAAEASKHIKSNPELLGFATSIHTQDELMFVGSREYRKLDWAKSAVQPPNWYLLHEKDELDSLRDALAFAGNAPIRFGFAISYDQKRALLEINPETYAAKSPASIRNLQWVGAGWIPSESKLNLCIETVSKESAIAVLDKINQSRNAIANLPTLRANLPRFAEWFGSIKLQPQSNSILMQWNGETYAAATAGLVVPIFQALNRQRYASTIAKLREIMIALHNYHDAYGKFPPAYSTDEEGNPLLSWRVLILPFLDESYMFNKFKLDEPWDSEHNRELADRTPYPYYGNRGEVALGKTQLVAPFGDTAIGRKGIELRAIKDGSSSTIAVMTVAPEHAVRWTQPDEFLIDQKDLMGKLIEEGATGFWCGLCDASLRFIPSDISPKTLKHLMLTSDGHDVILDGKSIQLPLGNEPATPRSDPNYDILNELPQFWFNEIIQTQWISGLSG